MCWSVKNDGQIQPLPYLRSNAEETDLRIWLHCKYSAGSRKMLYSPDTDVYHIGLPIVSHNQPRPDVYVQLHGRRKDSHRYLHANALLEAIDRDPSNSAFACRYLCESCQRNDLRFYKINGLHCCRL